MFIRFKISLTDLSLCLAIVGAAATLFCAIATSSGDRTNARQGVQTLFVPLKAVATMTIPKSTSNKSTS
jgi:hypothetical protein